LILGAPRGFRRRAFVFPMIGHQKHEEAQRIPRLLIVFFAFFVAILRFVSADKLLLP